MSLKRVSVGDAIDISAAAYNGWCEAAEDLQARRLGQGPGAWKESRFDPDVVLVRNDSGAAAARFGILGVSGPIITPTVNLEEFKRRVALSGVAPTADHEDAFVVLLEPLAAGAVGEAVISGAVQVAVDVAAESDTTCGAVASDAAKLKSGVGSNRILWKEAGTGTKWAVVRVGGGGGSIILGTLAEDLDAGDSAEATLRIGGSGTETVYDDLLGSGETLTSGTKVVLARINGKLYVIDASCSAS